MKSLVLAEKPSVARDIARVLGCHKNISGAIEGSNYIVTWALGHLVTLADPEEYDKKFKAWDMSYLPMVPKKWELVVIKQTSKQYHNVKTQLFRKDVSEIIIATDGNTIKKVIASQIDPMARYRKGVKIVDLGGKRKVVYSDYVTNPYKFAVLMDDNTLFQADTEENITIEDRTTKGKNIKYKKNCKAVAFWSMKYLSDD